jgi:hypothetical protein
LIINPIIPQKVYFVDGALDESYDMAALVSTTDTICTAFTYSITSTGSLTPTIVSV